MINENFVYVGVLLSLMGGVHYAWETIHGRNKPNRMTWFLWALAPLVAFTAMIGQGVRLQGALMTFAVGFNPLMIFIASFVNKKSVWKLTRFDVVCGALSAAGLTGWLLTQQGDIAIFFSILADGLAGLPTLVKAWKNPESEGWLVFFVATISATITLLTVHVWDLRHVGFPLYILVLCSLLGVLVKFKLGPKISKILKIVGKEEPREIV